MGGGLGGADRECSKAAQSAKPTLHTNVVLAPWREGDGFRTGVPLPAPATHNNLHPPPLA